MNNLEEILNKHWGFSQFRSSQKEIIESVLNKNDTLALLPTGAGKSLCYQLPAMVLPGICLVISPLVALMKDQVNQLKSKNIKAIALTGANSFEQTNQLLDNCIYGDYKFLYISPERLQQSWIFERIINLKINLVAIDEAHCISQWGHDFRTAYLQISVLKNYLKVPYIALTATATPIVLDEIIENLKLNNPNIFKKSFFRENIGYHVVFTEDKIGKIENVLKKHSQPAIIYVKNRKTAEEWTNKLKQANINATFYHGGLKNKEKEKNAQLWMQEKCQVIVATTAFGMGIDKANVKTVIHLNLPENLESYYQEVGRAGRNNQNAFGVLLTNQNDIESSVSFYKFNIVDKNFLKQVYKALNNNFNIAYGENTEQVYFFNFIEFCKKYNLNSYKVANSLQFFTTEGLVEFDNYVTEKTKIQVLIEPKEFIRFASIRKKYSELIYCITRDYVGLYEQLISIDILNISSKINLPEETIFELLLNLQTENIINLLATKNDARILFLQPREDDYTINRIAKNLIQKNTLKQNKFNQIINFIENKSTCKWQLIANYFEEKNTKPCGKCSVCLNKTYVLANVKHQILNLLQQNELSSKELSLQIKTSPENLIYNIQ